VLPSQCHYSPSIKTEKNTSFPGFLPLLLSLFFFKRCLLVPPPQPILTATHDRQFLPLLPLLVHGSAIARALLSPFMGPYPFPIRLPAFGVHVFLYFPPDYRADLPSPLRITAGCDLSLPFFSISYFFPFPRADKEPPILLEVMSSFLPPQQGKFLFLWVSPSLRGSIPPFMKKSVLTLFPPLRQ